MRRFLIAAVAMSAVLGVSRVSSAAEEAVTGVLIDQACAAKPMTNADPEKAAAEHSKACAMKDSCAKSGYAVISGKKLWKLDEKGAKLAKEYLAKADSTTKVVVKGTEKGDEITVTSIAAAPTAAAH